jgi:hypothetical protein
VQKIVEVGVVLQLGLRFGAGLPQLLALYLQLDLVDLQFMDEPLHVRLCQSRGAFGRNRLQPILRPAAQLGSFC